MKAAAERGLRYSYCVTSGNEPDLGLADYLNFVIDDPETRQVVLFIEGIRRPQAFMAAAAKARAVAALSHPNIVAVYDAGSVRRAIKGAGFSLATSHASTEPMIR